MTLLHTVHCPIIFKERRHLPVGAAINPLFFDLHGYLGVAERYQIYTPEVAGWYYVVSTRGWGEMDAVMKYARATGKPVFYHCLSWSFLTQPTDYEAWITEAMERYLDIHEWVVVNEDFSDPLIDWKFELARKLRPDARLWYNGIFYNQMEQYAAMRLVDEGLADGIGIQCHHSLNTDLSVYIPLVKWLADNCIPWRVTELDVAIPSLDYVDRQANAYRDAVQMCVDYGAEALTVWGIADGVSNWLTYYYPLPFGSDYQPKPAWAILQQGD